MSEPLHSLHQQIGCLELCAHPPFLHTLNFPSLWWGFILVSPVHKALFQSFSCSLPYFFAISNLSCQFCWWQACIGVATEILLSKSSANGKQWYFHPYLLEVVGDVTDSCFRVSPHSSYNDSVINCCCWPTCPLSVAKHNGGFFLFQDFPNVAFAIPIFLFCGSNWILQSPNGLLLFHRQICGLHAGLFFPTTKPRLKPAHYTRRLFYVLNSRCNRKHLSYRRHMFSHMFLYFHSPKNEDGWNKRASYKILRQTCM